MKIANFLLKLFDSAATNLLIIGQCNISAKVDILVTLQNCRVVNSEVSR